MYQQPWSLHILPFDTVTLLLEIFPQRKKLEGIDFITKMFISRFLRTVRNWKQFKFLILGFRKINYNTSLQWGYSNRIPYLNFPTEMAVNVERQQTEMVKVRNWVYSLAVALTNCGTLDKFLRFSVPQFLHEDSDIVLCLPQKECIRYLSNIRYHQINNYQEGKLFFSSLLTRNSRLTKPFVQYNNIYSFIGSFLTVQNSGSQKFVPRPPVVLLLAHRTF